RDERLSRHKHVAGAQETGTPPVEPRLLFRLRQVATCICDEKCIAMHEADLLDAGACRSTQYIGVDMFSGVREGRACRVRLVTCAAGTIDRRLVGHGSATPPRVSSGAPGKKKPCCVST